jgi:LPPG:FO 2-phospho-L-lactate transferase
MSARGYPVSSKGVADSYGDILDVLVIDNKDTLKESDFEVRTVRYDTIMTSVEKSESLAKNMLKLFSGI